MPEHESPAHAPKDTDADALARAAYEQQNGPGWDDAPEIMRALWRAYVAGTLPPR